MTTRKEIANMSDSALLRAYHWNAVRQTNEENSRRGLTKKTVQESEYLQAEMIKRFNLREDFEDPRWKDE
jgi:hypothetical protein